MFTTPYVVYLLLIIESYFTRLTDMLSGNAAASRRSIIVILHVSWFVIYCTLYYNYSTYAVYNSTGLTGGAHVLETAMQ